MKSLRFLFEILTNKKSVLLHLFILIILVIDFSTRWINYFGLYSHFLFILLLFSFTIIILHLIGWYEKHLAHVVYAFYLIIFVEFFIYLFFGFLSRENNGRYVSFYNTAMYGTSCVRAANEKYTLKNNEFSFKRTANSLGFPDYEWSVEKSDSTIRIICLGDSFTEGDGADYDSSYVSILRRNLQAIDPNIEVFNAGNCASDPFFNYRNFQAELIKYQPDIVIQSFSINDYYQDIYTRGGYERFQEDGTLKFRKNLWWEPIYAASSIFRAILYVAGGFDVFLMRKDERKIVLEDSKKKTLDLFENYQKVTEDKNIEFIVLSYPSKYDSELSVFKDFYQQFSTEFSKFHLDFYNLHPCYEDYVRRHDAQLHDFYWKKDAHHNGRGYQMMSACIEEIVLLKIKQIRNSN